MSDYELMQYCDFLREQHDYSSMISFLDDSKYEFDDINLYYLNKSNAYFLSGNASQALSCALVGLSIHPNSSVSNLNVGVCYMNMNKAKRALPYLLKAQALGDYTPYLYQYLCVCYYDLKCYSKQYQVLNELSDIMEDTPFYIVNKAICLFHLKEYEYADSYFQDAFMQNLLNEAELKMYVVNSIRLGQLERADYIMNVIAVSYPKQMHWIDKKKIVIQVHYYQDYETALHLLGYFLKDYPQDQWGLIFKAYCQIELNRKRSALNTLKKINDYSSAPRLYHLAYGLYHMSNNHYYKALSYLAKINDSYKDSAVTLALSNTYIQLNDIDSAKAILAKSLEYNHYQPKVSALYQEISKK